MKIKIDRQKILRLLGGYTVQVQTPVGLLDFEAEQHPWEPMRRVRMTDAIREAHRRIGHDPDTLEIWANDTYEAFAYPLSPEGRTGEVHLSVKRYDRMPVHNWRHLQQMKNEILGDFREAVELFPSEHRIADNANQTHLWVVSEGMVLPLGFPSGFVMTEAEVEQFNRNGNAARQEPMQPGLTTGDAMRKAREEQSIDPATNAAFQRILKGDQP